MGTESHLRNKDVSHDVIWSRGMEQFSDHYSWFCGRELFIDHGKIFEQNSDGNFAKGTIGNGGNFSNIFFTVLNAEIFNYLDVNRI